MEATKPNDKPETPQLVSLKDFVEVYQKLIAVAGVFVALALFWKNIRPEESTPYISYLCLLITLPVLFEVNRGYDYEKSTWTLVAFMQIFYGIILFTIYYLLVSYPNHLEKIFRGVSFFTVFIVFLNIAEKKIFGAIRKKDYDERVQRAKELQEKGLPVAELNTRIDVEYKASVMLLNVIELLGVIAVFAFTATVLTLVDPYAQATFDEVFDRTPQIDAPKSELELPKP